MRYTSAGQPGAHRLGMDSQGRGCSSGERMSSSGGRQGLWGPGGWPASAAPRCMGPGPGPGGAEGVAALGGAGAAAAAAARRPPALPALGPSVNPAPPSAGRALTAGAATAAGARPLRREPLRRGAAAVLPSAGSRGGASGGAHGAGGTARRLTSTTGSCELLETGPTAMPAGGTPWPGPPSCAAAACNASASCCTASGAEGSPGTAQASSWAAACCSLGAAAGHPGRPGRLPAAAGRGTGRGRPPAAGGPGPRGPAAAAWSQPPLACGC